MADAAKKEIKDQRSRVAAKGANAEKPLIYGNQRKKSQEEENKKRRAYLQLEEGLV